MGDFRSRSYADGRMQMEVYRGRAGPPDGRGDFRCYSTSYASSYQVEPAREITIKRGKSVSATSSSSKGLWGFKDPELQRKKRIAGYKMYTVEGRMKISVTRSFRWLKDRYTQMVYGFRKSEEFGALFGIIGKWDSEAALLLNSQQ
ncbi:hypothetical protein Taro_012679 [Colocasia esculenta]|uniref:Uncharacterized protein n=1 Tax=Colocasia esculenta TaxID=4460 RepID=A0A843UE77_COLES|nr:hypothetical protein [Colocasia esculenta]